ncbi:hypothetical protein ElyMa_000471300 [Elysia marginata]|uniref:Uncharacterized protein n=1 Tax=Elysia marginata TaxID=1093978 RepID=A0AAV4FRE4_9GAST|nr:hypothetical protein ElyMa_000471300 [Elysia marginata]
MCKSLADAYTDARPSKTFAKKTQNVSFVATDSSSHTSYRPSVRSSYRAPRGSHSFNFSEGCGRGFYKSQDHSHLSSSHRSPSAGRFQHKSASSSGSTGSGSVDRVPVKGKMILSVFSVVEEDISIGSALQNQLLTFPVQFLVIPLIAAQLQ